jgi:LmbE family N-acetylglucosaminyl deacetylase
MGSVDRSRDEIAAVRQRESERAAKIIQAEFFLIGVDDLEIRATPETIRALAEVVRRVKPDVILTHSPNDYMEDHRACLQLAEEASFNATVPLYRTETEKHGKLCPIYCMDTLAGIGFEPTEYVDITATFAIKRAMLACHESQVKWLAAHDNVDIDGLMEAMSRFRGAQAGVPYAEGFRPHHLWGRGVTERLLP